MITFTVAGVAAPKGSSSAHLHPQSGRVLVHASNSERLAAWERAVHVEAVRARHAARLAVPMSGAMRLTAEFTFRRPRAASPRHRPYPSVKPDLSKLLRGIEDALTGVLYIDDAQIVSVTCGKSYCEAGQTPGVRITLEPLAAPEGGR